MDVVAAPMSVGPSTVSRVALRYSRHARERMKERRISHGEVAEASADARVETPGRTPNEINRWGRTKDGRRLRITVRASDKEFVISVVAPEEEE